jgi:hypothetical protein
MNGILEHDPEKSLPSGWTSANRMFPICVHVKCQDSGTPEFWKSDVSDLRK